MKLNKKNYTGSILDALRARGGRGKDIPEAILNLPFSEGGGGGLPDPSTLEDGTGLIAVDGQWTFVEGYAYALPPAFEPIIFDDYVYIDDRSHPSPRTPDYDYWDIIGYGLYLYRMSDTPISVDTFLTSIVTKTTGTDWDGQNFQSTEIESVGEISNKTVYNVADGLIAIGDAAFPLFLIVEKDSVEWNGHTFLKGIYGNSLDFNQPRDDDYILKSTWYSKIEVSGSVQQFDEKYIPSSSEEPVQCNYSIEVIDLDTGHKVKTLNCIGYIGRTVTFAFATDPCVFVREAEQTRQYHLQNIEGMDYADFMDVLITEDGQNIQIEAYTED